MQKTVYVRDEDQPIWERARELAGDKLSPVITQGLRTFIREKEAEIAGAKGFYRIQLRYEDTDAHNMPKAVAFSGKWIFSPEMPLKAKGVRNRGDRFALAVTPKNSVLVYGWHSFGDQYEKLDQWLQVYSNFDAAVTDDRSNYVARAALDKIGIPVEELDI